ncbi:MAG: CD1871A family CXXC motif-containing protein [Clostridia bacterium]|nr:CD1871A family CXXC motif-containing protein [Clostridia bacterium]
MKKRHPVLRNICWIAVLLIAAGFIIYGTAPEYAREEWRIVLNNAVNICYQCIGLG